MRNNSRLEPTVDDLIIIVTLTAACYILEYAEQIIKQNKNVHHMLGKSRIKTSMHYEMIIEIHREITVKNCDVYYIRIIMMRTVFFYFLSTHTHVVLKNIIYY